MLDLENAVLVKTHMQKGKEQCTAFMENLQTDQVSLCYEPVKKNKAYFFKHERVANSKEKVLNQLFSRLFILAESEIVTCEISSDMKTNHSQHRS